jgi:hypothetical protein
MRAMTILRRLLSPLLTQLHAKRLEALFVVVESLLRGNKLSVTQLGRFSPVAAKPRHNIKRVDRLLGNEHLHKEYNILARSLAHLLLHNVPRPTLLVDLTELDKRFWAITAAVPLWGRSFSVYVEVHPRKGIGTEKVQRAFLHTLAKEVLPEHCQPLVVTDAGFKNPWYRAVQELGWDFLGRREKSVQVLADSAAARSQSSGAQQPQPQWHKAAALYGAASSRARSLGQWLVSKTHPLRAFLVLYKGPPRGRHGWRQAKGSRGSHPSSAAYKKYRHRAQEPWLLFSSLRLGAKKLVRFFSLRMQIEENYRDFKSYRFGWALDRVSVSTAQRWRCLLLIAQLCALAPILFGLLAQHRGLELDYQSSGSSKRRQLSVFFLGREVIARPMRGVRFFLRDVLSALALIRSRLLELSVLPPPAPSARAVASFPGAEPFKARCIMTL